MISSSTAAVTTGASGTERPPAQALTELLEALATLMGVEVTPDNQEQHKVDVAKLQDEIAQAKEELMAENARMATERAALDTPAQRIQADSFRLTLDQNASNEIMRRRHQSRLPPVYDARNLFNTPGAGTSDPLVVNWAVKALVTRAPVQPPQQPAFDLSLTPPPSHSLASPPSSPPPSPARCRPPRRSSPAGCPCPRRLGSPAGHPPPCRPPPLPATLGCAGSAPPPASSTTVRYSSSLLPLG
nr:branchpoint-bridging protein-like [Aegilops tauschii subsp. strangulata]